MMTAAELSLARVLAESQWTVVDQRTAPNAYLPTLRIRKGLYSYVAEVKTASEARSDRVVALLAQAILQAKTYAANEGANALAVILVNELPDTLIKRASDFRGQFAPDVAFGLFGVDGRRYFDGDGLADLTSLHERPASAGPSLPQAFNLFSDLNQWMLKVLLAPEIPVAMLAAPRKQYRSGTELAEAAQVSPMSVSRFLGTLRRDGFLGSGKTLRLVRREALFDRWKASALRVGPEQPFTYFVTDADEGQRLKFMKRYHREACMGLFAAADAYGLGHVSGVTPYVYVRKLANSVDGDQWKGIRPTREGEKPSLILRQPLSPESVFRGAVTHDHVPAADAIQVWLDVSSHPARGREQAGLIEEKLINKLIGDSG
ncbi:helix-turn-helix domain-containing protein [Cupriavidus plantarum]|uniref:helix-turn-helix domain-containing protein n=1 Tax=Cupriavidus plantarum TaxID=942865 RepID=UPI000E220F5F|nr:helix-turn-helix domain-containing protein [Cupriavidus plantarum]REE93269.1 hypothetical protein C7418_2032 [Cupriavidus plantarum]